ncbi:MAG TPA: hypothetical protein VEL77_15205 [Rugosimonospora sp.]|nr:hypothetical protein [Rugosimonospora sp.]
MPKTKGITIPLTILAPVSNDAQGIISYEHPYTISVTITGVAPFLFHRWNIEVVEEKNKAARGSRARKENDLESFVHRDVKGNLAIPTEYLRQAIIGAARYKSDPRSPKKTMMDLVKAGIVAAEEFCNFGVKDWDYVDRRRVLIQRNAITRSRPAMHIGWTVTALFTVITAEYISPTMFNELIQTAGKLIGIGNFRPSFGRFQVTVFKLLT